MSASGDYDSTGSIIDYVTGKSGKLVVQNSLFGIVFAIGASMISGILEVADLFINPLDALGTALGKVVTAIFVKPLDIVITAATTSQNSLSVGGGFDIGPFTVFLGVGVVLGLYWMVSRYLNEEETSNVIPAAPFDVSIPGFREEEDTAED